MSDIIEWGDGMDRMKLKMIALLTMTIDHIGFFLLEEGTFIYDLSRIIGRLAFPIFAFMIAEGFIHTRSKTRYFARLLILGIIVELMFVGIYLIDGINYTLFIDLPSQVARVNIMPTLFLGFLGIYVWKMTSPYRWWLLIPMLVTSYFLSYSVYGFLLIVFFGALKTTDQKVQGLMLITIAFSILNIFIPFENYQGFNSVQLLAVGSAFFIKAYQGEKGRYALKFFYPYYPIHLLILYVLSQIY